MKLIALVMSVLFVSQSFAQQPTPQPGTYYQSPTGLVRMERVANSGVKSHGMAKAMVSYGVAKTGANFTFNNPKAATQLTNRKPVFVIVSTGAENSTQEYVLARFEQKKDHRELKYATASLWSGVSAGAKDTVAVSVTRDATGNIVVTPMANLEDGEYLLTNSGAMGYDFGVTGGRQ